MTLGRASERQRDLLRLELACDSGAPAAARAALAALAHLGPGVGDATLVLSELVTNAVRHSATRPDQTLGVLVRKLDQELLLSVTDSGASGAVALIAPGEGIFGGLGLRIVDQLCGGLGHRPGGR